MTKTRKHALWATMTAAPLGAVTMIGLMAGGNDPLAIAITPAAPPA